MHTVGQAAAYMAPAPSCCLSWFGYMSAVHALAAVAMRGVQKCCLPCAYIVTWLHFGIQQTVSMAAA